MCGDCILDRIVDGVERCFLIWDHGWQYFTGANLEFLTFQKQLAHSLIYNRLVESDMVHIDGRQG